MERQKRGTGNGNRHLLHADYENEMQMMTVGLGTCLCT
jgi:hypothetical protein